MECEEESLTGKQSCKCLHNAHVRDRKAKRLVTSASPRRLMSPRKASWSDGHWVAGVAKQRRESNREFRIRFDALAASVVSGVLLAETPKLHLTSIIQDTRLVFSFLRRRHTRTV
eukprot:scpid103474/ scgid15693/ 